MTGSTHQRLASYLISMRTSPPYLQPTFSVCEGVLRLEEKEQEIGLLAKIFAPHFFCVLMILALPAYSYRLY